jgi:hypothetical protein
MRQPPQRPNGAGPNQASHERAQPEPVEEAEWRWVDLLGEAAEGLPANLRRRLSDRGITQRLAELKGFELDPGEDGHLWISGRLALGGVGAALAAANFTWMLVYHFGAPAVLLVRVGSAGELQVEVRQAEGSRLTWAAIAVAAGALHASRRLGGSAVVDSPPAPGVPATEVLAPGDLEDELARRPAWRLSWEPSGPVVARHVACEGFVPPWVLLNLVAPGLAVTWPEVEWLLEVGPQWAAVSLAPGEGAQPTWRLLAAVDWVEDLAADLDCGS